MSTGLTLISLNVRGIREKVKRKRILEWCKNKRGDIIFLHETYSTPDVEAIGGGRSGKDRYILATEQIIAGGYLC